MKDQSKTKQVLIQELASLRQRIEELEKLETERKKVEEMLAESETRYRELFDNISSGVAIYEVTNNGNDFIFKDFNRAGERLDGDRKEDIIGKSIYQVRPGINEFGLLEVFKRVWTTGISEHYPAKFYRDEQLQGWYENFVYRLPSGEIVAVYDDITERKQAAEALRQSEEKYRDIFDETVEGIYRTTPAGHFLIINQAFARICGYASPEEMKEKVTEIANQLYANPEDRLRFQKLIAAEGKVKDFEVQFKHPGKIFAINAFTGQREPWSGWGRP